MSNVTTRELKDLKCAMLCKILVDHGYPPDIAAYLAREVISGRMVLNQSLTLH